MLFNELCHLGFTADNVEIAINTLYTHQQLAAPVKEGPV